MGIGHQNHKNKSWLKGVTLSHGGSLRQKRKGRGFRPLSPSKPVHLVLKANRFHMRSGFRSPQAHQIVVRVIKRYAKRFFINVEQVAICGDHCHLLVRLSRRAQGQHFFRVVAGQIAQEFGKQGLLKSVTGTPKASKKVQVSSPKLWLFRPFTRVVKGFRAYKIVRDYIQLNKKEAEGKIAYKKERLKGLTSIEYAMLWSS
ncbi:hypothetical protein CIK05_12950 [Bdellovibrio sp. qaytius]|nr:hypothetical protein CIK05_12950 [Bdellovibrio sp. qaytius]